MIIFVKIKNKKITRKSENLSLTSCNSLKRSLESFKSAAHLCKVVVVARARTVSLSFKEKKKRIEYCTVAANRRAYDAANRVSHPDALCAVYYCRVVVESSYIYDFSFLFYIYIYTCGCTVLRLLQFIFIYFSFSANSHITRARCISRAFFGIILALKNAWRAVV